MTHKLLPGLLAVLWLSSSLPGRTDPPEPPVRLERKPRPEQPSTPERIPTLPKEVRESEPASDPDPASKSLEETLQRITRNLEKTDERLAKKDVGDGTRQIQTEVVRDLEALLEQMRQQQQHQQSSQASRKSAQKKPRPDPGDQKQQQTAGKGKPKPQPGDGEANQQASKGQGGGGRSVEEARKLADLYKDVWGHLPETLRQQMDAYGRERFMPRYNELLKQYYNTLSEKGRRKGD